MFKGMIDRMKVEVFIAGAIGSQISLWIGYFTAWGKLDWLFPPATQSMLSTVITGFLATVLSALAMVGMVRVYRLLKYLGDLADDAESEIEKINLRSDSAAAEIPSANVVGPSG